jgi:hypothetical protein
MSDNHKKISCMLMFHQWSKWSAPQKRAVRTVNDSGTEIARTHELVQYKECYKCGKIKIRTIKF